MSYFGNIDFYLEVAAGEVPGYISAVNFAVNRNIDMGWQTLWDVGGDYNYLSADTTLYVSSTSASDTAVEVRITGLDSNFEEVVTTATTNGQNQVAFDLPLMRPNNEIRVIGNNIPTGDLYIAESDTVTGGVPDTATKIQGRIFYDTTESPNYRSDNVVHNGIITVPADKNLFLVDIQNDTGKDQDVEFAGRVRVDGEAIFTNRYPVPTYQSNVPISFATRTGPFPPGTDIEFRAKAGSNDFFASFRTLYILRDI